MSVRAILFDLDGTLVDSIDDIAEALIAALVDHRFPAPTREVVRTWVGGGARSLVAHAVPPERVDAVLPTFHAHYLEKSVVHTKLYDGIDAVLDRMVGKEIALAVLSNKPHDLTVAICAQILAPWPFAVIAGQRPGAPLKPSPEPARIIAAEIGVPVDACVLVGDAPSDILCARAAGMQSAAVTWGYRPRAELAAAEPKWLAETPADLLALV
jgi:phosphoglycolate phosphatase